MNGFLAFYHIFLATKLMLGELSTFLFVLLTHMQVLQVVTIECWLHKVLIRNYLNLSLFAMKDSQFLYYTIFQLKKKFI